ncbi:hypothetical protein V2I01_43075 [Micromonospora sp. BRA006-A]|nr:hypothetical protein [Micromonospora sp. BRA006-A]
MTMKIDRNYLDVRAGAPPATWSVTVDNATSGGFSAGAAWGTSAYSGQRHGADYRFATPVASSDVAWFRASLPATGSYEVSVWYPADPGYNDRTPYLVATTTGNRSVAVDQRTGGGRWVSLGVFTPPPGPGTRSG